MKEYPTFSIDDKPASYYRVTVTYNPYDIVDYYFKDDKDGVKSAYILYNYALQRGFDVATAKGISKDGESADLIEDWTDYSLRS